MNNANNTGYVIPTPVIRHFLEDIKDGVYDGYVESRAKKRRLRRQKPPTAK